MVIFPNFLCLLTLHDYPNFGTKMAAKMRTYVLVPFTNKIAKCLIMVRKVHRYSSMKRVNAGSRIPRSKDLYKVHLNAKIDLFSHF